ncbi:MAG: metallophosphoesterase [Syntrophales bacterium]
MRIIYLADIHGAFARVKDLLTVTDAQVYIIAGDLIDRPFFTEEMAARYRRLQAYFSGLQCRLADDSADLDDFVDALLKRTDLPGDIPKQAMEYRDATIRARRVLQQKYKVLESILFLKGASSVFCLPGNYDMDLQYTSLHGRDLHRHWYYVAELRIAGYGGADVTTPGIPRRYAVPYNADTGVSEMTRFFKETRPDIIVTHKPAHGVHDHVSPMGESGSLELRRFCEENKVLLCLTGHVHDQWGFEEIEGTIYLNPSNFGEVPLPGGRAAEGGFYYSIDTRDRRIVGITLSKLEDKKIYDVAAYILKKGHWVKYVLDPDRFGDLLRGKSRDRAEEPGKPTLRDEMRQKMRWFFPAAGAKETMQTVSEEIESVASQLEERYGVSVSVDLLGDNVQSLSPVSLVSDVVLYLRRSTERTNTQSPHGEGDVGAGCPAMPGMIQEALAACPHIRIVDWIDLDRVVLSLQKKDYECDVTQRFAAYRAAGRRLRSGEAAFVENQLDADQAFRAEIEGTGNAYMEIFQNLAGRVETMRVFEARLRELGITAPEAFKRRIRECFHGSNQIQDQEAD